MGWMQQGLRCWGKADRNGQMPSGSSAVRARDHDSVRLEPLGNAEPP